MSESFDWSTIVSNADFLKDLFLGNMPPLREITLHEITLQRDGPSVLFRFDLQDFPWVSPRKWEDAGYNRIQLQFLATGVQYLHIDGLSTKIIIDFHIDKKDGNVHMYGKNHVFGFDLLAEFIILTKMSGYYEGDNSENIE